MSLWIIQDRIFRLNHQPSFVIRLSNRSVTLILCRISFSSFVFWQLILWCICLLFSRLPVVCGFVFGLDFSCVLFSFLRSAMLLFPVAVPVLQTNLFLISRWLPYPMTLVTGSWTCRIRLSRSDSVHASMASTNLLLTLSLPFFLFHKGSTHIFPLQR